MARELIAAARIPWSDSFASAREPLGAKETAIGGQRNERNQESNPGQVWVEPGSEEPEETERPLVLVVDDEEEQRVALLVLLRDEGYEVVAAASGEEALKIAIRENPDVVLADVDMPGMDGLELCRRLCALPIPPQVLFVSALVTVDDAIRGLDVGGRDYIGKPFDLPRLLAKLRGAVRAKREVDVLAARVSTDALTGLLTKTEIETKGREMIALAERHRRSLCALVVDIDRFKSINDEHGHPAGDSVLTEIARRIRLACRQEDQCFRMGGEEFLILAPEAKAVEGKRLAERLLTVASYPLVKLENSRKGHVFKAVTVSIGLAEWGPGQTLEDLIANADAALYAAKHGGRNRVEVDRRDSIVDGGRSSGDEA